MIRLNIIENDKKRFFETDKKEISLGRSINNDIMLRNSLSSRNHCIIEEQDKNFFIRDLQSRNGIRVNGKWIEQTPLYIGDLIQIGKVTSITVLAEKPSLEETDLLLQPEEPQIIPILQEVPTREELKKVPKEDTLTSKFSLVLNEREKLVRLYEITKAINSELHKEKLLEMIMDAAIELTKAERGCIFIIEENKPNKLEIARNLDRSDIKAEDFKLSQSVIQTVLTKGKAVITTNAQEDKRFAGSISVRDQQLRSVLCIPFLVKSKVLGVVYLDHRFVEVQFSQPDVHLLEVFAEQAAIAIENARLYEELQQKERISFEIETAALIQQQLLPTQAPEIKGLKIAGNTIPAHKVGGDYYDFIPLETDPNFLYICIGDVSGHGIAAGLIMVMIRSIFHALIPHKLSTKEILVEANKILFTSIPKNMFLSLNLLRWNAFAQKLTYT
ncbi:MAG: GAF domain-containing protein, partial [Planctomycetota bacterium]